MNEELKNKLLANLDDILSFLKGTAKDGVDFAKEQIPILVTEIAKYGFWSNMIGAVAWGIPFLICLAVFLKNFGKPWIDPRHPDDISNEGIARIASLILGFLFSLPFVDCLSNGIKALVAPRLYVLEQLVQIVKGFH